MKRGRPFEPGNRLGRGRPRGSRNKRSLLAKQLLEQHSEALIHKALIMALQGDAAILRALLGYVLPRPKDLPSQIGPLPMATLDELSQTFDATLKRCASGKIALSESAKIFDWIEARRRIIESQELVSRVSALEQTFKEITPPPSFDPGVGVWKSKP